MKCPAVQCGVLEGMHQWVMRPCACAQLAADELQTVEATLDAVLLNGTTNATGLASEINAASSSISTTPFPSATLNALTGSQVIA